MINEIDIVILSPLMKDYEKVRKHIENNRGVHCATKYVANMCLDT